KEKSHLAMPEVVRRAKEALDQVGLVDMGHKFPAEISGGMRKRVAIARALVTEPQVVFLDEPTTGLDPILVNSIHQLIVELHREAHLTAAMVSPAVPEVLRLAARIAVLHEGRIREVGTSAAIQESAEPSVRQFIHGEVDARAR